MPFMKLPNAAASIAFDFPIVIVVTVAALALGFIAIVALVDFFRTREKRRLEEGGVDSPPDGPLL